MKNVHLIAIFINMRSLRYNVKLEAVLVYSACFVIKKAKQSIDIFRQRRELTYGTFQGTGLHF